MEVTSQDYSSATPNSATELYTTEPNEYRFVNLTENETCVIAYDIDAHINNFFNGTIQQTNNREICQDSQILLTGESGSLVLHLKNYTECITIIQIFSYYMRTNLGMKFNTWYKLDIDKNNEGCICDWNHKKIDINDTLLCWCTITQFKDESLISHREPMYFHFRRICKVLNSTQESRESYWLMNCTFTNYPFPIEKLYFNISNTDQLETTSELIKSTSIKSTESSTATPSQTLLTLSREGSKTTTSENSSPQSTGSSNIITSLTTPKQNTHDESMLVPSTILRENDIHTSKTNTVTLNSLSRSSHTGNSQIVAEAQQGKLSSVANQYNYAFTTNPILFLFFLFFHFFMYFGFLRKEYFHMKKKRR